MIKKQNLESALRKIKPIKRIKEYAVRANKQVYLVGGVLRDILLDKEIGDIDVAISGKGEDFAKALGKYFQLKKGLDEIRVIVDDMNVDVLGLGTTEILDDLARRDFTINAMAYNLLDKRFIDPFNGVKDIENGIIRTISRKNIVEDSCRILRGLRFRATFGFEIEESTMKLLKEYSGNLSKVAPERIHFELVLIFNQDKAYLSIIPEIFDQIFPGFLKMKELEGGKITKDLLEHSILTLKEIESIFKDLSLFGRYQRKVEKYFKENQLGLRLSALLHDIKKPDTMEVEGNEIHFYGHDRMAGEWFKAKAKSLMFSSAEREYISLLIQNHMWIHLLSSQKEITERAKRRMIFRLGEDVIGLSLLALADQKASTGEEDPHLLAVCNEIIQYYFSTKDEVEEPLLKGRDLIEHFNLIEGPILGKILTRVQSAYEEGEIRTKEEALEFVREEIIESLDKKEEDNNMH
ncbi:MAG: hypothetical protein U9N06_00320 [candidate division WOR-3 bacterium]|nr:hypothetical protein [candidate division WOR-3 bacterium]